MRHDDGTELEIGPGDAYVIEPGHDAWVVGSDVVRRVRVRQQGRRNLRTQLTVMMRGWRMSAINLLAEPRDYATGGNMPEEFEGDLSGAVFWGADLTGARFRDVNLTDVKISHAWLVNVDIDALVDKVVINGVDVTGYVNERDPWYPLRAMIRPTDPEGMRAAWAALEDAWAKTITVQRRSPRTCCINRSMTSSPSSRRCGTSFSRWTSGSQCRSSEEASTRWGCRTAARSTSRGRASITT